MENIDPKVNKKVLFSKQQGNAGAAYLESVLSRISIVHRVDEAKDIGIDFFCELLNGEQPAHRLMFAVQCKTHRKEPRKPSMETLAYWFGLTMPVFEFWVKPKRKDAISYSFTLRYKRWTPQIHSPGKHEAFTNKLVPGSKDKRVNFDAFRSNLAYDYLRCSYMIGSFPYLENGILPREVMGEFDFPLKLQGWAMPFVQGVLRENSKTLPELELGRSCFKLALQLGEDFTDKNSSTFEPWKKSVKKHLLDIEQKIQAVSNNLNLL